MATFTGFSEDTFGYLQALAFNNNREWFETHRADYETTIIQPSLALISDMEGIIKSISPHYQAVAKKVGGSLMRIYRDTRFAKDKTPYKTNIGIQFRHQHSGDVHAPGFYVHLAVGECFAGVGTWHPEASELLKIRQSVANHPAEYTSAVEVAAQGSDLTLFGDSLKKVPRGFDPEHPLANELRRIDFLLSANLAPQLYLNAGLVGELEKRFRASVPYMQFLCRALDVPF